MIIWTMLITLRNEVAEAFFDVVF